jgi:hypothetical protein
MALGLRWDSGTRRRDPFAIIDNAKFLVVDGETGARGIRTLVAGFPTNRISRKRTEPGWPRLEPSPEYKQHGHAVRI